MRTSLVSAILLVATTAHADDGAQLAAAVHAPAASSQKLTALFADTVAVGPLLFLDAGCQKSFGGRVQVSGADRTRLADCLANARLSAMTDLSPYAWSGYNALFVFAFDHHKISAIGPYIEAGMPTIVSFSLPEVSRAFAPSKGVVAAIDKAGGSTHAQFLSCSDGKAAVTSRLAKTSGIAAYDKEATAFVAKTKLPADLFSFDSHRVAACVVWPLGHSNRPVKDIVQVVKIEKRDPYENGVEGGVEGGVVGVGGEGPPPPPPPPPPAPPQNVAPSILETFRIAGSKLIEPDAESKKQIIASGRSKVVASFKLCVGIDGLVTLVTPLKSSGFSGYDDKLVGEMHTWKYKPYLVNNRAVPVCTAVTFIYSSQ
jgi:hypothetical protein